MALFGSAPAQPSSNWGGRIILGIFGMVLVSAVVSAGIGAVGNLFSWMADHGAICAAAGLLVALWRVYCLRMGAQPFSIVAVVSNLLARRNGGGVTSGFAAPTAPLPPARPLGNAGKVLDAFKPTSEGTGKGLQEREFEQSANALMTMTGLDSVKNDLWELAQEVNQIRKENEERARRRLPPLPLRVPNMVFDGPPGTGKTTVANHLGRILHGIGALRHPDVVIAKRADFVQTFQGETAKNTKKIFESAMGKILLLDEAYALWAGDRDTFGKECLDTLCDCITAYDGQVVVIVAGYEDALNEHFFAANEGLRSRFQKNIKFEDYTTEQLFDILTVNLAGRSRVLSNDALETAKQALGLYKTARARDWGNARDVVGFADQLLRSQRVRLQAEGGSEYSEITKDDVVHAAAKSKIHLRADDAFELPASFRPPAKAAVPGKSKAAEAIDRLDAMVGMREVKEEIGKIAASVSVMKRRRAAGDPSAKIVLEHLVLSGPPGTGKTSAAEAIGAIYAGVGALNSAEVITARKSDLIAGYKGQTAILTEKMFMRSLGKTLFIDEAYNLRNSNTGAADEYGDECVAALIQLMTSHPNENLVILAGYDQEMADFMKVNPGLDRRFPRRIQFQDYTPDECAEIFKRAVAAGRHVLSEGAERRAELAVRLLRRGVEGMGQAWGNAGSVNSLADKIRKAQALRISRLRGADEDDEARILMVLEEEDVLAGAAEMGVVLSSDAGGDDALMERLLQMADGARAPRG